MKLTIDIGERFARFLQGNREPSQYEKETRSIIMSGFQNLRDQITNLKTTFAEGQELINSALDELASDIQQIPSNEDSEAEATRVAQSVTELREANQAFAQRVRDALPTAAPTDPLPAPVEGGTSGDANADTSADNAPLGPNDPSRRAV